MNNAYVARHNDIGLKVHSTIREGTMGRWLMLHDFGREDGELALGTIPEWMLPREDLLGIPEVKYKVRKADGSGDWEGKSGYKPDMVIVQGWPEAAGPPPRPMKAYMGGERGGEGGRRRVELKLVEFGVTSDLQWVNRVHMSKAKYAELVRRLRRAGWNVDEEVEVVTVGVRAAVPKRNKGALEGLGVDTGRARKALQEAMVGITA